MGAAPFGDSRLDSARLGLCPAWHVSAGDGGGNGAGVKADMWVPKALFDSATQCKVPVCQRSYGWPEEDERAPLWRDAQSIAEEEGGLAC